MGDEPEESEIRKTFGLDVLLELTRNNVPGVDDILTEIKGPGKKYYDVSDKNKLCDAVSKTMADYNIRLKIG